MKELFRNPKKSILFFIAAGVVVRVLFLLFTYKDSFSILPDSYAYDTISDRILNGNFDFRRNDFIIAPLYPLFLGVFKFIFGDSWLVPVIVVQVFLSAATVYYVWKLAELLFSKHQIANYASLAYVLYVPLFYFVAIVAQETFFLFFLMAYVYHFVRFLNLNLRKDILIAGVFFAAAYFTKSFVNLTLPFFILLILFLCRHISLKTRIVSIVIFFIPVVLISIPVGLNNYKKNAAFVTSSNGGGLVFFVANCDMNYMDVTNSDTSDLSRFPNGIRISSYDYYPNATYDSIMKLPAKDQESAFWKGGFDWIKENKEKFVVIRLMNLYRLIMPGNARGHHPFHLWLASLVFSLPLYLLAYFGILRAVKMNYKRHLWILAYLLALSVMHIMFIFTNRYRTYTYDIFYIVYAAFAFDFLLTYFKSKATAVS